MRNVFKLLFRTIIKKKKYFIMSFLSDGLIVFTFNNSSYFN